MKKCKNTELKYDMANIMNVKKLDLNRSVDYPVYGNVT